MLLKIKEIFCIDEIVDFLLKNGADQNSLDAKGTYPLEYVIKLKLNSMSIKLIETNKIDFQKK